MPYIHFTQEQKDRAARTDLEVFLWSRGEKLLPSGRDKRLSSDHSVTIRGNHWFDHATHEGGNAISFVQREAAAFDEKAVKEHLARKQQVSGCPGMKVRTMKRAAANESAENADNGSRLRQWPVQIRLAPPTAAFYQGADLLIAADCTAYAYGHFHQDFIRNRIVLIGCPKLDDTDYSLKLTDILAKNEIRSVTVVRMEVPCCGGISYAAEKAVARCGKKLPMQIITIGTDGEICR